MKKIGNRSTLVLAALLAACGLQPQTPTASPARPAGPTAAVMAPSAAPTPPPPSVFVVVMENRSYREAMADPQIAALAGRSGVATNYHAVSHPSLPNYLALTAGDTFGITDDAYHRLEAGGLGLQLNRAGIPWRAYFEGMSGGCLNSPPPYALNHNPFAYLGGACPDQVESFEPLDADLARPPGEAPRLFWITPGACNDGHDCSTAVAGAFLTELAGRITAAPAWRAGGVLFVVWDEDDGSTDNHVPLLVIRPDPPARTSSRLYDHFSLLAAIEDRLTVPRLGHAAEADALSDLLAP